jgi:hypothetical protein
MIRIVCFIISVCFSVTTLAQNVGIGTATPAASLDVVGTLKITDGSQGGNKILTSDANGLATWATAPLPPSFLFNTDASTSSGAFIGMGTSSSSFLRNTIVIPFNCELTSITLHGRGAIQTITATVYKASGNAFPISPVSTLLSTTTTSVIRFSSALGSVLLSQGDLISVQVSAGSTDGVAVSITYK